MRMRWTDLTMLHWGYPAEEVQALLPGGLTVETFDGLAWVGLVPFRMEVDIPFAPAMPSVLHFPETNVRSYVYGPSGEPGVYFWSLEASSLPAVVTARTTYQVPYFWASMSIDRTGPDGRPVTADFMRSGDRVRYESTRRWPKPRGARTVVDVEVGERVADADVSDFDNFLTARWALYGSFMRYRSYATMFHEPWPLYRAQLHDWSDELVAAAGFSQPTTEPVVHFSPGVHVRAGWPSRA